MPCPCSNSRCGCDFSTREKGKPDLSSIEVVSDIFFEAARKTAGRLRALEEGTLSPEELAAAQEHLADWIGATFSGKNRHYGSSEDWNPAGLASYARRLLADEMRRVVGFVPSDDTETIFAVALIYRRDLESALDSHVKSGGDAASFSLSAASVDLIHRWSRLMTGAPVELLLRR